MTASLHLRGKVSEADRVLALSRVAMQMILARMGENAARYRGQD